MWNDGLGCCVMPCHATAVSVPSGRFLSSPFHPLAPHWSLTALFSVPFPHHSFRSPPSSPPAASSSRLRSNLTAGSRLPLGSACPHHPCQIRSCLPLAQYVFLATGVLICKGRYSKETFKWLSIKQSLYPCLPLALNSLLQV